MSNFIPDLDKIRNGANFLGDIVRRAFQAVQAKFPVQAEDIASFFMSRANWNGAGPIPLENVPLQEIIDATTAGGSGALNCIDILRDLVVQYRDDDELYFGPGHVLHRGIFKKQTCNDDGTWVSAVAASLTIPSECPTSPGTTSGLEADTWYYVYAKLDVAGDAPEYRISKTPPVRCDGAGPEHPTYPKMRFLGSFRTGAGPDAFIKPFMRYANGWVFWRDIALGPWEPTVNLHPGAVGSYVDVDAIAWASPVSDAIQYTIALDDSDTWVRVKGDTAADSGYDWGGLSSTGGKESAWTATLPMNSMDTALDSPRSDSKFEMRGNGSTPHLLGVSGYHEALL